MKRGRKPNDAPKPKKINYSIEFLEEEMELLRAVSRRNKRTMRSQICCWLEDEAEKILNEPENLRLERISQATKLVELEEPNNKSQNPVLQ